MAKTVTTRLDDEYLRQIDELAARKGVDRSALLRSFLIQALRDQTISDSLKHYTEGKITLWEAAEQCNLTLWEMIQEVEQRGIKASYDIREMEKDLHTL
jgi:predicted transcriptional regulator